MIGDTIARLEAKLKNSGSLPEQTREELLGLLAQLRAEVSGLAETDAEKAQHIAGFAARSTQEATKKEQNPELLKRSLQELSDSVDGFEKSHPQLVQVVNRIATTLSNLGI